MSNSHDCCQCSSELKPIDTGAQVLNTDNERVYPTDVFACPQCKSIEFHGIPNFGNGVLTREELALRDKEYLPNQNSHYHFIISNPVVVVDDYGYRRFVNYSQLVVTTTGRAYLNTWDSWALEKL
jgi:hypothetical protein